MWPISPVAAPETFPKLQFSGSKEFWDCSESDPYQFECCSANRFKANIMKVVLSDLLLVIGQARASFPVQIA